MYLTYLLSCLFYFVKHSNASQKKKKNISIGICIAFKHSYEFNIKITTNQVYNIFNIEPK